jgi:hypothetical protein
VLSRGTRRNVICLRGPDKEKSFCDQGRHDERLHHCGTRAKELMKCETSAECSFPFEVTHTAQ